MPSHTVTFTPAAERQLGTLAFTAREMAAAAIVTLAFNPRPLGAVCLDEASHLWRLRVRSCSIVYRLDDREIAVARVSVSAPGKPEPAERAAR